ncbi:MAG: TniB family NTP-binding protein [Betaproteobacteria bacterium]|nr:TniB family NTP-binding protein [Betaproteobacteria bacterium]
MKPEEKYPHLSSVAASMADRDDEDRISYIRRDRFLAHTRAEEVLNELEMLYRMEDAVRPQGRLIVGRPLMGKSTIIDAFLRNHRASDNPDGNAAVVPVVMVQYPETASEGVYPVILSKLNARMPVNAKPQALREATVKLLRAVGMKILLIDELHNVMEGSANAQRKGLNSIKFLMNELRRPVVAAGTLEVFNAIQTDPQISSRLRRLPLERFKDDAQFQELLILFEMALPLRMASGLDDPVLSSFIFERTMGIVGHVADLLNSAAIQAINYGVEKITEEVIRNAGWDASRDDADLKASV